MADIEALEQLKRVLRDTPAPEFNMKTWACGSVGCALGRAAMDPWFNDRGLKLYLGFVDVLGLRRRPVPIKGKHMGYEAAELVFAINSDLAQKIFNPHFYHRSDGAFITRDDVIARIDEVIARN